ncbi:PDR/VanB family oxidoreductase [Amphritea sp. 2_MG-2023]|jgi:ferredoxin-NADP reductase|uniref:PDR/VanB family oxidoreductase n=1 Tax=Amphritea TaxID=515417 RepID=UPI001C06D1FA|nr:MULTISPECIES: PDR/VanB family oxidoreductase [Amphritea]MBU2965838.1 PDR/VanB family oxidoreductase [Amphritea atlantica]MDO6417394.1 PDR/VanB family oxidoreductase [Amphritea sp. 2_MG-2023]
MAINNHVLVKIAAKQQLTEDVVELTLVSADGDILPIWQPGAHVELVLETCTDASGSVDDNNVLLRHYSLCSDYLDCSQWKVAILREEGGRGGSLFIHNQLQQGDTLKVSEPRNHFPFTPRKKCLFIAGGIGITPMLPMLQQADKEGVDWRLVYLSRERSRMSCLEKLAQYDQSRITLNCDKEDGYIDLPGLLATCDTETSVYSCGPKPLLDALESHYSAQVNPTWSLDIERFAADPVDNSGGAFDVVINSTGQRIHIPEGQSALAVLREAGIKIPISCGDGICGSCETRVLSGIPDHRDSVLSEEEREENDYMMLCVSRALSPELILDL